MSSILDALRKVEREKAETNQPVEADFDEESARRDLIGSLPRGHLSLHISPTAAMALGGAFVLAAVAVVGAVWMLRQSPAAPAPVAVASNVPAVPAPAPSPAPEPPAVAPPVPAEEPEPTPAPVEVVARVADRKSVV